MTPIIVINDFSAGMLADPTIPATNGGQTFFGLDIHTESGKLQVSQKLTEVSSGTFTDLVKWIVSFVEGSYKYWALGNTGNLYKSTDGTTWVLDSNIGGSGQGMLPYNEKLYYCTAASLIERGGTTNTIDTDSDWHPLEIYLGKLMGGAGRYIFTLESDGTFTQQKLPLPANVKVKSLRVYGDRLDIGTWRGTSLRDFAESYLFTWNGTSDFPEQSFYLEECGINALLTWENVLLIPAGTSGNIWAFNNAFLDIAKQISKIGEAEGGWAFVNPGAVAQFQGKALIGLSIGSGSGVGGVYTVGRKTEDLPLALTLSHPISSGQTNIEIGAIHPISDSQFLVSWKYGSTYGMDLLSNTRRYSSGAYLESQKYEIGAFGKSKIVRGIKLFAEPLQTSNTITLKYDPDNSGSWTTMGTISSSNQYDILYYPFRADVVQFRPEFATASDNNYSPKLTKIEIY